jgi:hypothetical protein
MSAIDDRTPFPSVSDPASAPLAPAPAGACPPDPSPPPTEPSLAPPEAAEDPLPDVPPLSPERLPPNFRRHVEPGSPLPIRMMAAKGLVPFNPSDLCHCLAMLASDPDPTVAQTACQTASALPDKVLAVALRDDGLNPRVLDFLARRLPAIESTVEALLLNKATDDSTIARIVADTTSVRMLEIAAGNQLRLLRSEALLRALLANAALPRALVDATSDFAVRNGVLLRDVPALVESYERIHGRPLEPADLEEGAADTAQALMAELGDAVTDAAAPPLEEPKKLTLTQRVSRMSVAERIKLATLGNKEARSILMRDTNKLVALAVVNSPRITDGEVLALASSKTCIDEVLRVIYSSREWTRSYAIRHALVKNPKVPQAITLRMMATLRESDVKELSRNKNVPSLVRLQAKKLMSRKG